MMGGHWRANLTAKAWSRSILLMRGRYAIEMAYEYTGFDVMRDGSGMCTSGLRRNKNYKKNLWREALGFVIVCIGVWPNNCDLILSK
jgi:hypothetical protein